MALLLLLLVGVGDVATVALAAHHAASALSLGLQTNGRP